MASKKPPKYDYYNPSSWLVEEEQVDTADIHAAAEAAKTDDAFAKFERSIANANKAEDGLYGAGNDHKNDDENDDENDDGYQNSTYLSTSLRSKPVPLTDASPSRAEVQSSSPPLKKLPYRVGGMKIFADEELSDTDSDENWGSDEEGFPGIANPPRPQKMERENEEDIKKLTIAEQREKIRKAKMKQVRAKIMTMSDIENLDHDALVEKMMNPTLIPVPEPVKNVAALGKDGCAAVWWDYDRNSIGVESWVHAWEIKRYRLDKDKEWRYKGTTILNEHHLVFQNRLTVPDLENNLQYRFSVVGVNARGHGFESQLSAPVMVEAVLPPGWFRFFDERKDRFFYANIKTQQRSWTRPELDEWYLDESVLLTFNQNEIAHLKELFIEETEHFMRVTPVGFRRMMLETGEVLGLRKTLKYFKEYVGHESVTKWSDFMFIVSSLKKRRQSKDKDSRCWKLTNYTVGLPCFCWSECLSAQLTLHRLVTLTGGESYHDAQKIGKWRVEWHKLAERYGYTNTVTGEHQWDTPEEVRFYLPKKMEEQLLQYFNEGELQDFRVRFSHLDVNNSGGIDEHEFKLLLESMDMKLNDRHRRKLIREIDINGNGIIEFHEFCFMMLTLKQAKQGLSNIWDHIKVISGDAEKLHEISQEMVQTTQWEDAHGERDASRNPHEIRHRHIEAIENVDDSDPTSLEFQRQVLYKQREAELMNKRNDFDNQTFEEMLKAEEEEKKNPIKKQKFAGYTEDLAAIEKEDSLKSEMSQHFNLTNNAKGVLVRAGVDVSSATDLVRAGDSKEDGAYAKQLLKRDIDAGRVVVQSRKEFTSMSRFAELLRPLDEVEEAKRKRLAADPLLKLQKERKSYTGESYVDRITRKREEKAAAEAAAAIPSCFASCMQLTAKFLYATSLGVLVNTAYCIVNFRQGTLDLIDSADLCIDYVLCEQKAGIHGKHCMCGCRFMYPEDVRYPFWTDVKTEPLNWEYFSPPSAVTD